MNSILLIDDDQSLSQLLREYLEDEGFTVRPVYNGQDGLKAAEQQNEDLIILDIMLPGMTGIEVLKHLRHSDIQTPVLMLTAKGDDVDRILGLELGADDYLPKPCNPRELLARIRAILRRQSSPKTHIGKLEIFSSRFEASYDNSSIKLTGAEFKLLEALSQHLGEIVSKEHLCETALGRTLTRYDRSVDVHISNLRKKLVDVGAPTDIIVNQRGTGYLLKPE